MSIFEIGPSLERKRPEIDWDMTEEQIGVDWDFVEEILDGKRPLAEYEPIQLLVPSPHVDQWHCYRCPGMLHLMSVEKESTRERGGTEARSVRSDQG